MSLDEAPPGLTLWVLAPRDDAGLAALDTLPPEVARVVGQGPDDFREAPPPDVVLVCSVGWRPLEAVWPLVSGARWIHARSAGVDHLLFPALVESPVPLTNGRGVFGPGLAEFVAAAVLFFAKDLRRMQRSQEAGAWDVYEKDWVRGRSLGIVGYGDIGRTVARLMSGLGMRLLALSRAAAPTPDPLVDAFFPLARRLELLASSDYVLVATPLTSQTRGIVGEAEIAAMKETAVLINVGRGPCVDEAALVRALEERRIRGAALDVFETEPLPAGHPFYRLDNVLLSAHCADNTPGWRLDATRAFVEHLGRYRRDGTLPRAVDKRRGY